MHRILSLFFALTCSAFAGDLQLTLPPVVYATPDVQMSIYHDNIVLTELNLDPVDGYPNNNGVHPNPVGYAQIGASFYSWMKAKL